MFTIPLVLAQAAPIPGPVEGFYQIFLHNGLMGAAVALLLYLLIKRDGDLQKSQEGRLTDAKSLADLIKDHTTALQASNIANDERNRALEVAARAAEKNALVVEQLAKEITELKESHRVK